MKVEEHHLEVVRGAGSSNQIPSVGQVRASFRGEAQTTVMTLSWVLGNIAFDQQFFC